MRDREVAAVGAVWNWTQLITQLEQDRDMICTWAEPREAKRLARKFNRKIAELMRAQVERS